MVTTERVAHWIDASRHPTLASWRSGVANRLLHPIPPPVDAAETVAPLTWLLNRCIEDGGTPLTATNNLARATVLEATERFGWWDWDRAPRSESDVHQLIVLRDAATRMRLVRRQARRLHATGRGAELASAPEELWRAVSKGTEASTDFTHFAAELLALRLLQGVLEVDDLASLFGPVVLAAGWQTKDGPLSDRDLSAVLSGPIRWWRLFSVLEEQPSTWERETGRRLTPHLISFTPSGEAMALAYLRQRAIRPMHRLD